MNPKTSGFNFQNNPVDFLKIKSISVTIFSVVDSYISAIERPSSAPLVNLHYPVMTKNTASAVPPSVLFDICRRSSTQVTIFTAGGVFSHHLGNPKWHESLQAKHYRSVGTHTACTKCANYSHPHTKLSFAARIMRVNFLSPLEVMGITPRKFATLANISIGISKLRRANRGDRSTAAPGQTQTVHTHA
jgi:hypothetical protein